MFKSYNDIVQVLVLIVIYPGTIYWLYIYQSSWRNDAKKFFIAFTLVIASFAFLFDISREQYTTCYIAIFGTVNLNDKIHHHFDKNDPSYLSMFSSLLIVHTIWNAIKSNLWSTMWCFSPENCTRIPAIYGGLHILLYLSVMCVLGASDLLPYCPAMVEIFDGIVMSETELHATNSGWVQAMICTAIILLHISSLIEIYHLKFSELTWSNRV